VAFTELLKAILMGMLQGITEWLPISSTGHMILLNEFIQMNFSQAFTSMFLVVIQFGSILAVLLLYFNKLNPFSPAKSMREKENVFALWLKVAVAVIPAAVVGLLFEEYIDRVFFNPRTIGATLIIYGILFIFIENRKKIPRVNDLADLSYKTALFIGIFQILALIPGTSRSGATILGAIILGTSRGVAAEFSFFLAIPVMLGASLLKTFKYGLHISSWEITVLLVGMISAFIVSVFAIRFLVNYVKRHDFKPFGYYRIVLGLMVLLYFAVF
jgi:undecaprenyl-diphosphatase